MLGRTELIRGDVALAVQRVAERIDDPSEQFLPDRDLEQTLRPAHRIALRDVLPLAEQHGADVVGLTVPTSVRSALVVSRPSIRLFRIEVISSGLISIAVAPVGGPSGG